MKKSASTTEDLLKKMQRKDCLRMRKKLFSRRSPKGTQTLPKYLQGEVQAAVGAYEKRLRGVPSLSYPDLPIVQKREEIIKMISSHRVFIVSGETGSGKTTQLPKLCLEAGRGIRGQIVCTQPRRIAALTVASRIAEELKEEVGQSVSCKIRFHEKGGEQAYIKVVTDGMLLAEIQGDPELDQYDTLILDEAHERNLNIDFLLGIAKNLLAKRKDLKLIITSATLDTEKFSRFFSQAPVIEISGRSFPVEIYYREEEQKELSLAEAVTEKVKEIRMHDASGDILVFMPTERDIMEACALLKGQFSKNLICPLYARLSSRQQRAIFARGIPKIVVATNVAETSITIDGIRYVIDTGLVRQASYAPATKTFALPVLPISQSSANQRAGRCGRTQEGICFRLYTQESYDRRDRFTPPEIFRVSLAGVILRMLSLKLGDPERFPFLDPPSPALIRDGYRTLVELGALSRNSRRANYLLTPLGKEMARLPVDPHIARVLLQGSKEGALREVLATASAMVVQDPREQTREEEEVARQAQRVFLNPTSDFLSLLAIWEGIHDRKAGALRRFCRQHFLSFRRMREWFDVHQQLALIMGENGHHIRNFSGSQEARSAAIHRAITAGHLSQIAFRIEKNRFRTSFGRELRIFPSSALFGCKQGEWIVCSGLVKTSQLYARMSGIIEPDWLLELGAHLCEHSYHTPRWSQKRREVIASEEVRLFGLTISRDRPVSYGPINQAEANEIFIRSGLIDGLIEEGFAHYPFLKANRALVEGLKEMEHKLRRKDIFAGEEALYHFYKQRIPHVTDLQLLDRFLKEKGQKTLMASRQDLVVEMPKETELDPFPNAVRIGDQTYQVCYHFAPGEEDDGASVHIPQETLPLTSLDAFDWVVSGLLRSRVTALLQALPKVFRKKLIPMAPLAEEIFPALNPSKGSLITQLSQLIQQKRRVSIPSDAWREEQISDHLRLRFSIRDGQGNQISASRDRKILLSASFSSTEDEALRKKRTEWEQVGLSAWTFGSLPPSVRFTDRGPTFVPTLVKEDLKGTSLVCLRLKNNPEEAPLLHKKGVAALARLTLSSQTQALAKQLSHPRETSFLPYSPASALFWDSCLESLGPLATIRDEEAFLVFLSQARETLPTAASALVDKLLTLQDHYSKSAQTLERLFLKTSKQRRALLTGFKRELSLLLTPELLNHLCSGRLPVLSRAVQTIAIQAEKGSFKPLWEREKAKEFMHWVALYGKEQPANGGVMSYQKKRALEGFFWDLLEFRATLFAQELRPPKGLSAKSLGEKLQEIQFLS